MAYIGVSPSNGVRRVHTYTATASQTTFSGAGAEGTSLSYKDSNFVDVYQNGIKLGDADYTSTSGTSIVLAQGASVDDLVVVVVFDVFSVADTVSKADGGTFDGNVTMAGTLAVTGTTALTGNATFSGDIIKSTSGTSNFAAGVNAGNSITSGGNYNVTIGDEAGTALTTGDNNVAVGYAAFDSATDQNGNVAIGYNALTAVTASGDTLCTAVGSQALASNTAGYHNTAVGFAAQDANTHGIRNVSVGRDSLGADTKGNYNVAIGDSALATQNFTSSTDVYNTAVGYEAGKSITTGQRNVSVGGLAGDALTTGNYNVAIGTHALGAEDTGGQNTAVGDSALFNLNTSGNGNAVAVGINAGYANTTGVQNTFIGASAGNSTGAFTDHGYSVMIGYSSGQNQSNYSVAVGNETNFVTYDHSIVLGYNVDSVGANHITFGKNDGSDRVYNQFTSNASWTRVSDERYKTDIKDNTDCGLDFINDLRPVTFKWKSLSEIDDSLPDYDKDKTEAEYKNKMYGLIAQEVKQAMEKHNITDFGGHDVELASGIQGISQEMFVHPLIKSVQELSAKITALEAENKTQATQIADLISRITALENAE